jgi:adenine-specific DNA-methyltransferase
VPKKKGKNQRSFSLLEGDVIKKLSGLKDNRHDLIITSPPYNIRKSYERGTTLKLDDYVKWLNSVIELLARKLSDTGSICWQVGNYIDDGEVFPLDMLFYPTFKKHGLKLRNRIVWHFNFGLHSTKRLSGRYETVLWFTKSDNYKFNNDAIRVPQLYPGKRHAETKSGQAGKLSGNPLGKNASDFWTFSADEHFVESSIWELPNVKANHPEKTIHPCQFPLELAERCVLAFTDKNDVVLDPFVGAGTSIVAALKHGRRGVGIDKDPSFLKIARDRIESLRNGTLKTRPLGKPVCQPNPNDKVAKLPTEWKLLRARDDEIGHA